MSARPRGRPVRRRSGRTTTGTTTTAPTRPATSSRTRSMIRARRRPCATDEPTPPRDDAHRARGRRARARGAGNRSRIEPRTATRPGEAPADQVVSVTAGPRLLSARGRARDAIGHQTRQPAGQPPGAGPSPPGPAPAPGQAAQAHHADPAAAWLVRIVALLAILLAAALAWFLIELFQPFGTSPHGRVKVVIPPNSSSSDVGKLLHADGVVSSSFFFELRATLAGDRSDLRSGTYHLQKGMSYSSVLKKLTTVPPPMPTTKLTIADGHSRAAGRGAAAAAGDQGQLRRADAALEAAEPGALRRAEEHAGPRGLPVPGHVQAAQAGQAVDTGRRPADATSSTGSDS